MELAAFLPNSIILPDAITKLNITSLSIDSRNVERGALFFAMSQERQMRDQHIFMALEQGASLVFYDEKLPCNISKANVLPLTQFRMRVGEIIAAYYGNPSQKLKVIGVTGTNGKTSVCHLLAQALSLQGCKTGILGTAGNGIWPNLAPAGLTTLDVLSVHRQLRDYLDRGVTHVTMEVSSHGLDQARVAGVTFELGVFTNLSRDHLDYHRDMRAYAKAKRLLFDYPMQCAILNCDDKTAKKWLKNWPVDKSVVTYSLKNPQADFVFTHCTEGELPRALHFLHDSHEQLFESQLIGKFNDYNLLAVLACLYQLNLTDRLTSLIYALQPVNGRMHLFQKPHKPFLVVDFAHTPDALEKALKALRPFAKNQLICVFGCGGDRASGKRPIMAKVAQKYADKLIITNDNPRTESPEAIVHDIIAGLSRKANYQVILDRQRAITAALTHAREGDVVLVAGKGHEAYQIVGDEKRDYSDLNVAQKLMETS